MKKTITFVIFSTALGLLSARAEVDCQALSVSVKHSVAAEQSKVLEIVSAQVGAAPSCACEIVKAAIEGSKASTEMVAAIVETASTAAPDQMRLIAQCAVAVAPDALGQVQAVTAKLDPNRGDGYSSKSSKDAKTPVGEVAGVQNPLDFPGQGPVGPLPGENPYGAGGSAAGGAIGGPGGPPPPPTPPVNPPDVSDVNP
jgi:hypothetical protein